MGTPLKLCDPEYRRIFWELPTTHDMHLYELQIVFFIIIIIFVVEMK